MAFEACAGLKPNGHVDEWMGERAVPGLALCLPNPGRMDGTMSGEAETPSHEDSLWTDWLVSNFNYLNRIFPICQTGNTDRSEALRWEFPMSSLGRPEFFGCCHEEVYERAAEGRNRSPLVADQIEMTGHGKALDS